MKVVDVSVSVIRNPPPSFATRHFVLVRVTTDDGLVGWGEVAPTVLSPAIAGAVIVEAADRVLVGHDPRQIEAMWTRVGAAPEPMTIAVVGALEIACWDIVGKAVDRPVHELLGGRAHTSLRAATVLYPSTGFREVRTNHEHAAARAANEVERGFSALVFDAANSTPSSAPAMPTQDDVVATTQMLASVRSAVGTDADVVVRMGGAYTAAAAVRLAHELEAFDPLWLDQPCSDDRPDALAVVSSGSSAPVGAGATLSTAASFAALARAGAAGVWRPDPGRCGGILAARKVAALAEANGVLIAPTMSGGPVLGAAVVQFAVATANLLVVEGVREWGGIHADLLTTPMPWNAGRIDAPEGPGLGIEIDIDVANRHAWTDAPLPPPPA
ncbi:MAG: mandelate racemase/muconate lactonizing enzyme family protein [Ilumatobacter sp.]